MLSASWERAAKPGTPPTLGILIHLLGATSLQNWVFADHQKQRLFILFVLNQNKQLCIDCCFLFYLKRGVWCFPLPSGLSTLPPDIGSSRLAEGPAVPAPLLQQYVHSSALTWERTGTSPGAGVHYGHAGSSEGSQPLGLLCMWLF